MNKYTIAYFHFHHQHVTALYNGRPKADISCLKSKADCYYILALIEKQRTGV